MFDRILSGVVGSHAYGLARADSDVDTLGVMVAPTLEVAGLNWSPQKETITNASPFGDDQTFHEVGKFIRLALKVNPTISELLWLDDYTVKTELGMMLVEHRRYFLSEKYTRDAYLGYAKSQLAKFQNLDFKKKHARHALRLLNQGDSLLYTGHLNVRVEDPQVYWDLDEMTPGAVLELLTDKFTEYTEKTEPSALPEAPNYGVASDLLDHIRKEFV